MLKSTSIALLAVAGILWSVAQLMSQDRADKQFKMRSENQILEMQRNGIADSLGDSHPSVRKLDARIRHDTVELNIPEMSGQELTVEMKFRNLAIVVQNLQRHVAALEVEVENLKKAVRTATTENNETQD